MIKDHGGQDINAFYLFFREMRAQGEDLRKEMFAQEERQRAAMDDLMEAIDVRAQVAELGEDVR